MALDRPHTSRWARQPALLASVVLLAGVATISYARASQMRFDFSHFYADAQYVWQHGALNPNVDVGPEAQQRQLPFYLPGVSVLLAPLAAVPLPIAAAVWALVQVSTLAYSLRCLWSWLADTPQPAGRYVAVLALGLPALLEAAKFNQLSFPILALVLAFVQACTRGRAVRAGVWLGLACVLKLVPAIFLVWLVLKRQWAAAGVTLIAGAAFALLPCLVVFGPQRTLDYHRAWWDYNRAASTGRVVAAQRDHFIDHRNQSIGEVVARVTRPAHRFRTPWQPVAWSQGTADAVARGIALALMAGLVWRTWRPLRRGYWKTPLPSGERLGEGRLSREASTLPQPLPTREGREETTSAVSGLDASRPVASPPDASLAADPATRWRLRAEFSVYALGMLVFAPLLRQYYLVWALPAFVLVLQATAAGTANRFARHASYWGWVGVCLWTLGMAAWLSHTARLYGVHLLMLIGLGVVLLAMSATSKPARQMQSPEGTDS